MSEPSGPEYAAALDRLLDGITAEGEADAQVRADTDSIARALGLIGDALAAEGGGVTAAAGAVPPAAAGGTVVAMSSWRSRLNPRVLAAAASLVVLLGIGIPLTISSTGGSGSNDTTAAGAPEAATERSGSAPMAAPDAAAPEADAYAGGDDALSTTTDKGTAAAAPAPATAGGTAAGSATVPGSAGARKTSGAAGQTATPKFADAVACARAIVVGTIAAVQPAADGSHYDVTIVVEDWIAPESGPATVTHRVFGSTANSPGEDESVRAGMRRLFVVAASPEERIYAFRPADWPETKKRIAAIRAERAGAGCP